MAWIARLDARVAHWPRPIRWSYLAVKWTLVILGAYLLIGTYWIRSNPKYWTDMLCPPGMNADSFCPDAPPQPPARKSR